MAKRKVTVAGLLHLGVKLGVRALGGGPVAERGVDVTFRALEHLQAQPKPTPPPPPRAPLVSVRRADEGAAAAPEPDVVEVLDASGRVVTRR